MFAPKIQKDCPVKLVLSEVLLNQFYSGITLELRKHACNIKFIKSPSV